MKNLLSIYEEIFRDTDSWKYYSSMNPVNPFENHEEAREFIMKFIELSGKADDNILYDDIKYLDNKRINHIVSTFFLGIYIYCNIPVIKKPIDKILKVYQTNNPKSKIEFSFLWFLICLFHDLGYRIENNNNSYSNFNDFLSRNCSVPYFLKSPVGVPKVYSNTYEAYFNYKIESKNECFGGKPDHGICGGVLLYDVLNKIVNKRINDRDIRETKGLYWDRKLLSIYKRVSWVILSHNIYFAWEGNANFVDYKGNAVLQELILTKELGPLVKLNKHPLLFLFLLVDCVEPIKLFEKPQNFSELKLIEVESVSNSMKIIILNDNLFQKIKNNVKDLQWYLIPEISYDSGNITFNFGNC